MYGGNGFEARVKGTKEIFRPPFNFKADNGIVADDNRANI